MECTVLLLGLSNNGDLGTSICSLRALSIEVEVVSEGILECEVKGKQINSDMLLWWR